MTIGPTQTPNLKSQSFTWIFSLEKFKITACKAIDKFNELIHAKAPLKSEYTNMHTQPRKKNGKLAEIFYSPININTNTKHFLLFWWRWYKVLRMLINWNNIVKYLKHFRRCHSHRRRLSKVKFNIELHAIRMFTTRLNVEMCDDTKPYIGHQSAPFLDAVKSVDTEYLKWNESFQLLLHEQFYPKYCNRFAARIVFYLFFSLKWNDKRFVFYFGVRKQHKARLTSLSFPI